MTSLGKLSLLAFLIVATAASAQRVKVGGPTTTGTHPTGGPHGVNVGGDLTTTRDLSLSDSLGRVTRSPTLTDQGSYARTGESASAATDGTTSSEAYTAPPEDPALDSYIASGSAELIDSLPTVGKMRRAF